MAGAVAEAPCGSASARSPSTPPTSHGSPPATVLAIGKLRTPNEISNKPGSLTEEEWAIVRRHPAEARRCSTAFDPRMVEAIISGVGRETPQPVAEALAA